MWPAAGRECILTLGFGRNAAKPGHAAMVGVMVTPTILTLVVIPAIYFQWKSRSFVPKPVKEFNDESEKE
jgi:Cu/Ag efflux pump CusA